MILVTVGTQLPFDRLIEAVDKWAAKHAGADIVAQIGPEPGFVPVNMVSRRLIDPAKFAQLFENADIVIAHAGIGTILAALEHAKPIVVMPRRVQFGEQRTDHQLATAKRFADMGLINVAHDEHELAEILSNLQVLASQGSVAQFASGEIIDHIRGFLVDTIGTHDPVSADGIVCFGGEDWWYHNRGHYDLQMMREASKHIPVLYINSIGMRSPRASEGRMFVTRVARKTRSFLRGLVRVRHRFSVYSPVTSPLLRKIRLGRRLTAMQVKLAIRRSRMRRPVIWVAVPTAGELLPYLEFRQLVYQRTDRFEEFNAGDADAIRRLDRALKNDADVTLFASHFLLKQEAGQCKRALFVDHGVDYERFVRASINPVDPPDVAAIPRPRIGFIGGVDAHTFNPKLFVDVVRKLADYSFLLVGAISLPGGWCEEPNVWMLGRKPYSEVPDYMASCDVLMMPWRDNEWIKACNPVKLKEYLATGRPVVSTWFPELDHFGNHVMVAGDSDEFAAAITSVVEGRQRNYPIWTPEKQGWSDKLRQVVDQVDVTGI